MHTTAVSGAGIAWFLAKKFNSRADLGLAALGAVADCLPLLDVNRSLVVHGLKELRLNPSLGIRQLIATAGLKQASLSATDLGFGIGPRLNAVGRLADPTDGLRLLCSQTPSQAAQYARSLNDYNQHRQNLQKESLEIAQKEIDLSHRLIFISGQYNPGIIGLIAGRLTEKYYLPSIVVSKMGEISKGSCRSIPELNIIESLRKHQSLFIDLGGHAQAAGFSLKTANIPKLKKLLTKTVDDLLSGLNLAPQLSIDAQMEPSAVTKKNIEAIQRLAPFGIGNPEPLFLFKSLSVSSLKVIGSTGDHLKLRLNNLDAIAFKKGELIKSLKVGDTVDVVAHLSLNIWQNTATPQLIIKEIITQ